MSEPKLAPPGAGLAWHQWLLTRFIVGPFASQKPTWEQNLKKFQRETERIELLLQSTPQEKMKVRVLVSPRFGLEDSSRYWSIAMALEHLVIVGRAVTDMAIGLSRGIKPTIKVDTGKVKPLGQLSEAEALAQFREFCSSLEKKLEDGIQDRNSALKHPHPWFGPFSAKQWVWLLGIHQGIHRKQIEDIQRASSQAQ